MWKNTLRFLVYDVIAGELRRKNRSLSSALATVWGQPGLYEMMQLRSLHTSNLKDYFIQHEFKY